MNMNAYRLMMAALLAAGGGATVGFAQAPINAAAQVHIEAARKAAK